MAEGKGDMKFGGKYPSPCKMGFVSSCYTQQSRPDSPSLQPLFHDQVIGQRVISSRHMLRYCKNDRNRLALGSPCGGMNRKTQVKSEEFSLRVLSAIRIFRRLLKVFIPWYVQLRVRFSLKPTLLWLLMTFCPNALSRS